MVKKKTGASRQRVKAERRAKVGMGTGIAGDTNNQELCNLQSC